MNAETVLAVHPFDRGFGWILFEEPYVPLDWGVVERRYRRNEQCLTVVRGLVLRYRPVVLALEAFDLPPRPRAARIRRLCRSIVKLAALNGVEVSVHARRDVHAVMGQSTRYAIAATVAQRIEPIRSRLPTKRAVWESERPNMSLFSAAAVGLTYYASRDQPTLL